MDERGHVWALLIGIDDYPVSPLRGCVNDVLGVHDWLVRRAKVPPERITRLITGRGAEQDDRQPTLANIRTALTALACVEAGSRVFIYYSGHGAQETVNAQNGQFSREAIVPVDAWQPNERPRNLLWDYELNTLLQAIVATTAHVTCVFDCCHSAGVTRSPPVGEPAVLQGSGVRRIEIQGPPGALPTTAPRAGGFVAAAASGGWAQIVACEASEVAREADVGEGGRRHGLLTRALLEVLELVSDERAHQLMWSEVWYSMLDKIGSWNPRQHPRQFEAWARPVLGGPPATGDLGIRITRATATEYLLFAGTIAGLAEGTRLAVYGRTPEVFPPIGTPEELAARIGLVRVTRPRGAAADAVAFAGESFDLPPGARARVIEDAPVVRMVVHCDVADPVVNEALTASQDRMRATAGDEPADVWLARGGGNALVLGDDCYTATELDRSRTLLELANSTPEDVGAVLEHYRLYCEPLRTARRCRDLSNALELEILDCSDKQRLADLAAANGLQDPDLPAVAQTAENTPVIRNGQPFCVRIINASRTKLEVVALLCCTSDGQVELFGEQLVPALGHTTFWFGGQHGNPFVGWLPDDRNSAYERLVAIGTTVAGTSFARLQLARTFGAALRRSRSKAVTKDFDAASPPKPVERWTGIIREVRFER